MSTTVIIECISWLIKVTDKSDARWKPEITFFKKWSRLSDNVEKYDIARQATDDDIG